MDVVGSEQHSVSEKSLAKGLLAGLIGGIVAMAAKNLAERIYPPQAHEQHDSAFGMADNRSGHASGLDLGEWSDEVSAEAIDWGFGALAGAAYGAVAEYYPAATSKDGADFGLAMAGLTHGKTLSALGLGTDSGEPSPRGETSEMASHVVYGIVTEVVRKFVRNSLG